MIDGDCHCGGPIRKTELVEDRLNMGCNGSPGDAQAT